MTLNVHQDEATGVLKVSGPLDIETANSLRETLLRSLLSQAEVTVDAADMVACDAAGLQVLLAARKDGAAMGKAFFLRGASAAVLQTAEALGLPWEGEAGAR